MPPRSSKPAWAQGGKISAALWRGCAVPALASRTAGLDAGRIGIAAPVFDRERAILGSLSLVLPAARADEGVIARFQALTVAGAREIERAMANGSVSHQRVRPA